MNDDVRQPPKNLGMTDAEVLDAYRTKATVRYWPVIGQPCRPHVGQVHGLAVVGLVDGVVMTGYEHEGRRLGLYIGGKAGWVLPSHCEVVGDE